MAGEMQPGEYESAYIGFAAIQPRRTPPHSEGELWRRGGRGAEARGSWEVAGARRVSRSRLTSGPDVCDVLLRLTQICITRFPDCHTPPHRRGELSQLRVAAGRARETYRQHMPPPLWRRTAVWCTAFGGVPWAGRGRRAASRAVVQRRVEPCVGTVRGGEEGAPYDRGRCAPREQRRRRQLPPRGIRRRRCLRRTHSAARCAAAARTAARSPERNGPSRFREGLVGCGSVVRCALPFRARRCGGARMAACL